MGSIPYRLILCLYKCINFLIQPYKEEIGMYDDDKPIDPEWQKECAEMENQVDIEFQCYKPEFSEDQQKVIDNTAQKLLENIAFCEQHQELFIPEMESRVHEE